MVSSFTLAATVLSLAASTLAQALTINSPTGITTCEPTSLVSLRLPAPASTALHKTRPSRRVRAAADGSCCTDLVRWSRAVLPLHHPRRRAQRSVSLSRLSGRHDDEGFRPLTRVLTSFLPSVIENLGTQSGTTYSWVSGPTRTGRLLRPGKRVARPRLETPDLTAAHRTRWSTSPLDRTSLSPSRTPRGELLSAIGRAQPRRSRVVIVIWAQLTRLVFFRALA